MRKRFVTGSLICLLWLSMIPMSFVYADSAPTVTLALPNSNIKVDEAFQVQVKASNLKNLYGYELNLTYDRARLAFVQSDLASGGFSVAPIVNGNAIKLAHTEIGTAAGLNGSATLATLTFKATDAGVAEIALGKVRLVSSDMVPNELPGNSRVLATIQNGTTSGPIDDIGSGNGNSNNNDNGDVVVTGSTLSVAATVDEFGNAEAQIDDASLQKAIQAIENQTLFIKVQMDPNRFASARVTLPVQSILSASQDKVKTVNIQAGDSTVSIATDPASQILNSDSRQISLSIDKVNTSKLPVDVQQKVNGYPVYDFSLSVDGKKVDPFKSNQAITISMKHTLKSDENPLNIVVYFINDQGELQIVKNGFYDQATGSITFKPKHFSTYAGAYNKVTFLDLESVSWAEPSITALAARDIVQGTGNGNFEPQRSVTRAEFVQMLLNSLDLTDLAAVSPFKDVDSNAWYYSAVSSAAKLGIVSGYENGTFGANQAITREQMAVMAYGAAKAAGMMTDDIHLTQTFQDEALIAAYARGAVGAMEQAGILHGMGDGTFKPKQTATRAQAAMVIGSLLK